MARTLSLAETKSRTTAPLILDPPINTIQVLIKSWMTSIEDPLLPSLQVSECPSIHYCWAVYCLFLVLNKTQSAYLEERENCIYMDLNNLGCQKNLKVLFYSWPPRERLAEKKCGHFPTEGNRQKAPWPEYCHFDFRLHFPCRAKQSTSSQALGELRTFQRLTISSFKQ